jgi:hypothetical protein
MQTLNGRRVHQAVGIPVFRPFQITHSLLGDSCQLGLPVQHLEQGRHF